MLTLRGGPEVPPTLTNRSDIYRYKWKQIQYLADLFWKRWTKLYLPELQLRSKWYEPQPSLKEGDIVLIMDENTPRNTWPMGKVLETKKGRDDLVRSVKLKTKSTVLTRPIHKLVYLEGS